MNKKTYRKFKVFFSLLVFGLSVFLVGFIFLERQINTLPVTDKVESMPYYTQTPDNKTILFKVCNDNLLLDFDFKNETLNVLFLNNGESVEETGYTADFTVTCNYETVGYLVDAVGGIEFENDGVTQRYTGVQIADLLTYSNVSRQMIYSITEKIIEGIKLNGITKENLLYLIENTETDLKFSDSVLWLQYIPKLCEFTRYIN